MRKFVMHILSSLLVFLASCGNDDSTKEDGVFKGLSYSTIGESDLVSGENQIKGNGTILFTQPLGSIDSNNHFTFSFLLEDGQSISLVANAAENANNGFEFVVERSATTAEWKMVVGSESIDIDDKFKDIDITKEVRLAIDIHNKETPAHVIVWNGDNTEFKETNAIYNSAEKHEHEEGEHEEGEHEEGEHEEGEHEHGESKSPGNGKGTFWGFKLSGATLNNAGITTPKVVED